MKNCLEHLLEHFPVGTAEGERQLLAKAYVKGEALGDLVTPPPGSPRLLIGRKGTGKTAILQYASAVLHASGIPFLSLKPIDLDLTEISVNASVGALTRGAYNALLGSVAGELGTQTTGLLSSEDQLLYEESIKQGKSKRDRIGVAARLLPKIAKPLIKVDLTGLFPGTSATAVELRQAIADNLRTDGRGFYLFLDDTDQVASPVVPDQLNRIWAFLLAGRELTQKIEGLRVVITLREEVWRRLIRDKAGQRDQADHFQPLVRELAPTREHIRAVIERRLRLAAEQCGARVDYSSYEPFFEGSTAKMPQSDESRSWEDLIVLRSRERPRDAVQMIQALAYRALRRGATRIQEQDFHAEMPAFSAQRVMLLAQEVEAECPQIREIVDTLADVEYDYGSFKVKAQTLRSYLRAVPSMFSTTLFGRTLQPDSDEAAFALWSFLFELGVLNARVSDVREKDGFRHVQPREDATLVSKSRWRDVEGMIWEVNPAYRDFLVLKQEEAAHRTGLPSRRRPRR